MRLYDLNFSIFRTFPINFISRFFLDVAGGMAEYDSPFDTLATLAEVGVLGFLERAFLGFLERVFLGFLGGAIEGFLGGAFLGFL